MRVALIIYGDLDYPSGGFLYDKKLVEYLGNAGHHIELLALPWQSYAQSFSQNLDKALIAQIEASKPDILLQDELNHPSLFLANSRIKRKLSLPIVSIVHHLRSSEKRSAMMNKLYQAIERRYLNSVDAIISNSHTTLATIKPLLQKEIPLLVAQPGGDRFEQAFSSQQIAARSHSAGPLRILFLGALIRRKSAHLILDAMTQLPIGDYELYLAGNPSAEPAYAQSLVQQAASLGLAKRVHFLGQLPEKDLAALLVSSHILLVPSSYEGYGIAYVEAMGFGLPAIAGALGAANEIIEDRKNGFLLSAQRAAEIAEILMQLHQDRRLLFQMSLAASKRYEELPRWADSLQKIEGFLAELVQAHRLSSKRAGQ